jgi:hypothetical protein
MASLAAAVQWANDRDSYNHKINMYNALTLSGHARTPSGCKSGDNKRTVIKNKIKTRLGAPRALRAIMSSIYWQQIVI